MERTHKNLYHAVSREGFTTMVAALDAKIPSLERHEVIVEMAKIVAAVADGHTNIYPTRDPKIGFHSLPVVFTFFGDALYVRAADESQRPLAGARVLRIGDRDITDAYAAVKTMIGRENEQGARYWAQYLLAMPEVLHALRITRKGKRLRRLAQDHPPQQRHNRPGIDLLLAGLAPHGQTRRHNPADPCAADV